LKVKTYPSFDVLPEPYLRLFEEAETQWYDFSLPWFRNFVETALDASDKICIYGVEDEGRSDVPLAALATRYKEHPSGIFSPTLLSSLSNFYTITFSPTGQFLDDDTGEVLGALARGIANDNHRWDLVELRPLDPSSAAYPKLVHSFRSAGMVVQEYFCFGNWYLPTAGLAYDEYLKGMPSAMQNTIRRKKKKLEKTGKARIDIITGTEGLEDAIDAYSRIYLSSWKRSEPYPHFVPGLIRTCAGKKWLRMGVVYLDDQPIAAQVWIVNSGKATIYKLAHDQRYDEFSSGSTLTTHLIQHVLEVDKVREIDFGSGDDPYKKNWLSQRRERWGILAMNPRSLAGCMGILQNVGGRAAKNAWQALRRNRSGHQSGQVKIKEKS
jgi:hypothetical protein